MIRRVAFAFLALTGACSVLTDLDGFTSDGDGSTPEAGTPGAQRDAGAEAAAPVCAPGQIFTSDAKNCGACGHDCFGGACLDGACQPVVISNAQSAHVRLDATHAYLVDESRNTISRVPKRGGSEEILATGPTGLYEFALSQTHLYFQSSYGVQRVAKTGGAVENIAATKAARFILVDGDDLFWAGWASEGEGASSIWRANLDGSNPRQVKQGVTGVETLARDGDRLFYGENGQQGTAGAVRYLSLSGETDALVTTEKCRRLVIDDDRVYFLDFLNSKVWTTPRTGGAATALADSKAKLFAGDIAQDERFIYWAVQNVGAGGGVFRVAKSGGTPTAITSREEGVAVEVDDAAIYWSHKSGGIYLVAKPL